MGLCFFPLAFGMLAFLPSLTALQTFHSGLLPERARRGALAKRFDPPPQLQPGAAAARWLDVPLDYDAPAASPTFRIRYFVDASAFDPSNDSAPIFVSMGGEGTTGGAHCSLSAWRHRALCVSVEHRFYGESVPSSGGVSTANYWQGLKVEHNLADTAAVVSVLQAAHPTASKARRAVIAFGGSYSGATCAWFRQSHPSVVDACVSSSGVVNAILVLRRICVAEVFDVGDLLGLFGVHLAQYC